MERIRCLFLLALSFGLSSCVSAPQENSTYVCDPEELYSCYSEVLEQVLPIDLYVFSDIAFRRYDTYARSQNPTEFVASLSLVHRNGERVIEASYRRLLNDNLYMQLAAGAPPETAEGGHAAVVKWSDSELTSEECPAIVDVWEKARNLALNDFSEIRQFDTSSSSEEGEIIMVIHPRIYEAALTVDDQTITVVQRGGSAALSNWVNDSITALESCSARK